MTSPRLLSALLAFAAACLPLAGHAEGAPPLKIFVGYSAGGAVDAMARIVGQELAGSLKQPLVVENRPGAGTNIAVKALIDSKPDGNTLLMSANALSANSSLYQPAPFDAAKDIAPVALIGRIPVVIATNANSPLKTLADLVKAAGERPGRLSFATPGNGSTPHLAMAMFEHAAHVKMLHIPYKGGAPAISDTLGGQVDCVAVNELEVLPLARSGKLRVLAVMGKARSPALPNTPTVAESGFPQFEASVWYGLVAPAATPKSVVEHLNALTRQALAKPSIRQRLTDAGGDVEPGTAEQFRQLILSDRANYEKVVREDGIRID